MNPTEKTALTKRARAAGYANLSEYLRCKAAPPDCLDDPAIDELLHKVGISTRRASAALDAALAAMARYEERWGPAHDDMKTKNA